MPITRYHLKDEGQDLTHIDIEGDKIVAAGVSSTCHDLYVGMISYDYWARKDLKVGDKIRWSKSPEDPVETFKYPIVRIEEVDPFTDLLTAIRAEFLPVINSFKTALGKADKNRVVKQIDGLIDKLTSLKVRLKT